MKSKFDARLGRRIRTIRDSQKLKQEYMAERLNVDVRTYRDYENGKTRISIEKLTILANVFAVSTDEILTINENRSTANQEKGNGILEQLSSLSIRLKIIEERLYGSGGAGQNAYVHGFVNYLANPMQNTEFGLLKRFKEGAKIDSFRGFGRSGHPQF